MAISFLALQPQQLSEYQVALTPDLAAAIDRWRLDQKPVQEFDQALASLALLALAQTRYLSTRSLPQESDKHVDELVAVFEAAAQNK